MLEKWFNKDEAQESQETGQETPPVAATSQPEQASVSMTPKQLQEMMAGMAKAIVEEIKKPSPEEAEKLARERELAERRREEMLQVARAEEDATKQRQASCNHQKPNGQLAIGGQVFSDGVAREYCLRCQKLLREYKPGADMVAQGFGNVTDQFSSVQ